MFDYKHFIRKRFNSSLNNKSVSDYIMFKDENKIKHESNNLNREIKTCLSAVNYLFVLVGNNILL